MLLSFCMLKNQFALHYIEDRTCCCCLYKIEKPKSISYKQKGAFYIFGNILWHLQDQLSNWELFIDPSNKVRHIRSLTQSQFSSFAREATSKQVQMQKNLPPFEFWACKNSIALSTFQFWVIFTTCQYGSKKCLFTAQASIGAAIYPTTFTMPSPCHFTSV